jgi:hypothetical protein
LGVHPTGRRDEFALRREQPLLRYWDAEMGLHFVGGDAYKANFSWIANDSGPGQIEIPFNTPLAQWIHDTDGRIERGEGRNIVITVDYVPTPTPVPTPTRTLSPSGSPVPPSANAPSPRSTGQASAVTISSVPKKRRSTTKSATSHARSARTSAPTTSQAGKRSKPSTESTTAEANPSGPLGPAEPRRSQ